MRVVGFVRDKISAAGRPGVTVTLKRHLDSSVIASVQTDGSGKFTYQMDGHPGPFYYEATDGGDTKRSSSLVVGPVGEFPVSEAAYFFRTYTSGILSIGSVVRPLEIGASGSNMTITVTEGAALVGEVFYRQYSNPKVVTIAAADPSLRRLDTIAIRAYQPGHAEAGRCELVVLQGTPSASPQIPAVATTGLVQELQIGVIDVPAGATAIPTQNAMSSRNMSKPILAPGSVNEGALEFGAVSAVKIADGAIVTAKLANGAVTAEKIAAGAIPSATVTDGSITTAKLADSAVTTAKVANGAITAAKLAAGVIPGGTAPIFSYDATSHSLATVNYNTVYSLASLSISLTSGWTWDIYAFAIPGGNAFSAQIVIPGGVAPLVASATGNIMPDPYAYPLVMGVRLGVAGGQSVVCQLQVRGNDIEGPGNAYVDAFYAVAIPR